MAVILLLQLALLRDVGADDEMGPDAPCVVADGGDAGIEDQGGAGLAVEVDLAAPLVSVEGLPGPFDCRQTHRAEQVVCLPADGLGGPTAEQALGAGVPEGDAAIQVAGDDRIARPVEQVGLLADVLLGQTALSDVPGDAAEPDEPAFVVVDRGAGVEYPALAAVGPDDAVFLLERRAAAGDARLVGGVHLRAVFGMDGPLPGARVLVESANRLAPDALVGGTDVDDALGPGLDEPEDIVALLGELQEPLLLLPQILLHPAPILLGADLLQGALDGGDEPAGPVLDDIVGGTVLQGGHGGLLSDGAGKENVGHERVVPARQIEGAEPVEPRQGEIREDQVEFALPVQGGGEILTGIHPHDAAIRHFLLEQVADQLGVDRVVLQVEDAQGDGTGFGVGHDWSIRRSGRSRAAARCKAPRKRRPA